MSQLLLGLVGKSGASKSLCADYLRNTYDYYEMAFANIFKEFIRDVFGFSKEQLWGSAELRDKKVVPCSSVNGIQDVKEAYRNWHRVRMNYTSMVHMWLQKLGLSVLEKAEYRKVLDRWLDECERRAESGPISPRMTLQLLGTEYGTDYKKTIWVDYLLNNINPGKHTILVSDCRMKHEIDAVHDHDGYVIHLLRKRNDKVTENRDHPSEVEQDSLPATQFDLVLNIPEGKDNVYVLLDRMVKHKSWESGVEPTG